MLAISFGTIGPGGGKCCRAAIEQAGIGKNFCKSFQWHGAEQALARDSNGPGAELKWHEPDSMELFRRQTVASPIVASLRGEARSAPVWWEALEGARGSRILHNPLPRPKWIAGALQMSIEAVHKAHGLVIEDDARCDRLSHSFPFFTGLCEKELRDGLRLRTQRAVTNDCSAKGLE